MKENKPNKKNLITGSSGMVGTRLFETLLNNDYDVIGVDKQNNKWSTDLNKKTIICDLRNNQDINNLLPKRIDMIIHLAANARVYNLVVKPLLAYENFQIIFNILEFARHNSISEFVFSSSREVYGNTNRKKSKETDIWVAGCESAYTASKIAGEALTQAYRRCYGIKSVIVRLSNIYGMYDDSDRVVPLMIKRCIENQELVVFGLEKKLDFTYIDDVVEGFVSIIDEFEIIKNNTYNLAMGKGEKLINVATKIKEFIQSQNEIVIRMNRTGEVVRYVADISKARKYIGFNPKIGIDSGLQKTIKWYKEFYNKVCR